jgi:hypothetical protein
MAPGVADGAAEVADRSHIMDRGASWHEGGDSRAGCPVGGNLPPTRPVRARTAPWRRAMAARCRHGDPAAGRARGRAARIRRAGPVARGEPQEHIQGARGGAVPRSWRERGARNESGDLRQEQEHPRRHDQQRKPPALRPASQPASQPARQASLSRRCRTTVSLHAAGLAAACWCAPSAGGSFPRCAGSCGPGRVLGSSRPERKPFRCGTSRGSNRRLGRCPEAGRERPTGS